MSTRAAPRWETPAWFPQTKLRPPTTSGATLSRPHLLASVAEAVAAHRLTLVAAPAGSGKSTLLAALPSLIPDRPISWLALDADDNDPVIFVTALVAALREALPAFGTATVALLGSLPEPGGQLRRLMGTLVNDLLAATSGPFLLVIDDLHIVSEPTIHAALDHLLERLPDWASVVIATRYDPPLALARLRARGQLAEVRLAELRFGADELASLFNEQLALGLADSDLLALHRRTGGWAAGLRLLALMLGRLPTPEARHAFVLRLGDDGRFIFDFLAEEVLGQQEPELQRFLLDIAILPELSAELCRAVSGREDAAQLLDRAYRRNLFLTLSGGPIAETGTTLRFHDLFADFLRGRLAAESAEYLRELHRRAARAVADPARAIAHHSAAGDWDEAARAVEACAPQFTRFGMYRRLHDWIGALPEATREARPRLLALLGAAAFYGGRWDEARPLLERAEAGFARAGDQAAALDAALKLVDIAARDGEQAGIDSWVARAKALGPLPMRAQVFLQLNRAYSGMREGNLAAVGEAVANAVNLTLASDDPEVWNLPHFNPPLALGPAGPAVLERYCEGALRRYGDEPSLAHAAAEALAGYLAFSRGRFDAAAAAVERAAALSEELGGHGDIATSTTHSRYLLALVRGDYAAARETITVWLTRIGENALLRGWLPAYRYWLAKAEWAAGRVAEARETAANFAAGGPFPGFPLIDEGQELLAGMLATSAGDYTAAEHHLRSVAARRLPYYNMTFWLDHPQVLLAHAQERAGRPREALATVAPVLAECERLDTPGVILKVGPVIAPLLRLAAERGTHPAFAARLLDLFDLPVSAASAAAPPDGTVFVPETRELLSPREVEVLRLLASGATNAAIADALFISPNTVKTHVARLLAKLGVPSRTGAAARARDLGIV
jgi:LuxR family maltose regulon positive regulatory protein